MGPQGAKGDTGPAGTAQFDVKTSSDVITPPIAIETSDLKCGPNERIVGGGYDFHDITASDRSKVHVVQNSPIIVNADNEFWHITLDFDAGVVGGWTFTSWAICAVVS
jgi:hypothetical protein